MRLLVTGARGMLGSDLRALLSAGHQVTGIDISEIDLTRDDAPRLLAGYRPEMVLHCAAMTDVDGCERDPEAARDVNGEGTRHVALACRELGAAMLYISTDYVFDGAKGQPYCEWDNPNPLGHYGRSKLEGEQHVRDLLKEFYIVRTSWLYGNKGRNFVRTVLARAREAGTVRVVSDQVGSPTYAKDLGRAISRLISSGKHGTYHLTNSGSCSRYDLARKAVELAGIPATVVPITSGEYPTPTRRPAYSVLRNFCWERNFGSPLRPWEEGLADYLAEVGSTN